MREYTFALVRNNKALQCHLRTLSANLDTFAITSHFGDSQTGREAEQTFSRVCNHEFDRQRGQTDGRRAAKFEYRVHIDPRCLNRLHHGDHRLCTGRR